ncbi:hypothetical protein KSC_098170 [Ktedonobacter sp. SOSP1-52]|nr:hypothetical protein KSC_098170 [Ktedonobacter sp. SOSP1-52]
MGLNEKEAPSEIGAPEISVSEIGPDQVGQAQVGVSEVSPNKICSAQVGAPEIGASKFGPDQVSPSEFFLLMLEFGPHQFACAQQQVIDLLPMGRHVQTYKSLRAVMCEAFGFFQREVKFLVERAGWLQRQGFA